MKIEDLKLFVSVVKLGSFTAAAHALNLPRANVSRRIGELEKELEAQLFFRTTRTLKLTPPGQAYYHELSSALRSLDHANSTLQLLHDNPTGHVKFGVLPGSESPLIDIVLRFQALYPAIKLELFYTHSAFADFFAEGLDLALHSGPLHDSNFIARKITAYGKVMIASPEYLAAHGMPKALNELQQHRCLCYRWPDGSMENTWVLLKDSVKVSGAISSNNYSFLLQAAQAGQGISFVPLLFAAPLLTQGKLIHVLPHYQSEEQDVWLMYPDRFGISYATRLLVDFLLQEGPKLVNLS